jgi:hypothetical protein
MKRNLKRVTALALAALTAASMSSAVFAAKQGDVDDDGILTANDAAMVYQYAMNKNVSKFGEKVTKKIEAMGAVRFSSIVTGDIEATDAVTILDKIRHGGNFSEGIKKDYEAEVKKVQDGGTSTLVSIDGGKVSVNQAQRAEDGSLVRGDNNKIVTEKKELGDVSATDSNVAEILNNVGVKQSQAIVFSYGKTPIRVDLEDTDKTKVLDQLSIALQSNSGVIEAKAAGLKALMNNFTVNGISLGSDEGWKILGETIAAKEGAFDALRPTDVDSAYLSSFVDNLRAAFPASYKETALANVAALNIRENGTSAVELTIDNTTYTNPKEVVTKLIENILYVDGTYDSYNFKTLTLKLNNNDDNTVKVTKSVVVQ